MARDLIPQNLAIRSCGRQSDWLGAVAVLERLRQEDLHPDVISYTSAMKACTSSSSWVVALGLFSDMQTCVTMDTVAYNVAIRACAAGSRWQLALALVLELSRGEKGSSLAPDVATFSTAMGALGKRWPLALQLLELLRASLLKCDGISYNVAVSSCAGAAQWAHALSLLKASAASSVGPDRTLARSLLGGLDVAGTWRWTLQVLAELPRFFVPGKLHLTSRTLALEQSGNWPAVLNSLSTLAMMRISPNSAMYSKAIGSCEARWPVALHLLEAAQWLRTPRGAARAVRLWRWREAASLLGDLPRCRLAPDTVAASASGASAPWQRAGRQLSFLRSMRLKEDLPACNVVMKSCAADGRWQHVHHLLSVAQARALQPDIGGISICLRCDWREAAALLVAAGRQRLRLDSVSCNAAISGCEGPGQAWRQASLRFAQMEWAGLECCAITAASLLAVMEKAALWQSALLGLQQTSVSACGSTLSACAGQLLWELTLDRLKGMYVDKLTPSEICLDVAIRACATSRQEDKGLAVLDDAQEFGAISLTRPSFHLMALATLGIRQPELLHSLLWSLHTLSDSEMTPQDWANLLWSLGIMNLRSEKLLARISSQASLGGCTWDKLASASQGAASLGEVGFLLKLQEEAAHREVEPEPFLNLLWSCHFANCLSRRMRTDQLLALGRQLDAAPAAAKRRDRQRGSRWKPSEEPEIRCDLSDRVVLYKPPGWEVHDGYLPMQLRSFLQKWLGEGRPIAHDASHSFGFLHRLDVPSSGLILAAKTYEAYYDLRMQLATGRISRRYVVLAHGWLPHGRTGIDALLTWRACSQTRAGGAGKPSKTRLRTLERSSLSFSLLLVQILTGRRHQIRSHLSFVGHPVVRDELYSSSATFNADLGLCTRNFLHRCSLEFEAKGVRRSVEAVCPTELLETLRRLFPSPSKELRRFLRDGEKAWAADGAEGAVPSRGRMPTPAELQQAVAKAIRPDGKESRLYGAVLAVAMGWWQEVSGDEKLFPNALARAAITARRELGAIDAAVRPTPARRIRELWDDRENDLKTSGALAIDLDSVPGLGLSHVFTWGCPCPDASAAHRSFADQWIETMAHSAGDTGAKAPISSSSWQSRKLRQSSIALVACVAATRAQGRRQRAARTAISIGKASSSDLRPAADVAVRSLRWTAGWLDGTEFTEEDYSLLASREVQSYQSLYLADRGYPCTFLVARSSEQREPAKEANSWFDWGGSGGSASSVVGCVGCEVKCFSRLTNEELPTGKYDGGQQTVLRPVMADLAVSSECRGKGIARKLVEELERVVLDWGYEELVLLVEATNFQARGVYGRLGYRLGGLRLAETTLFLDKAGATPSVAERKTVAFLLRKCLKPFPLGDLENTDWPSVLVVLGLGIVLVQRPDLAKLGARSEVVVPHCDKEAQQPLSGLWAVMSGLVAEVLRAFRLMDLEVLTELRLRRHSAEVAEVDNGGLMPDNRREVSIRCFVPDGSEWPDATLNLHTKDREVSVSHSIRAGRVFVWWSRQTFHQVLGDGYLAMCCWGVVPQKPDLSARATVS
ncbi:unnamed protein product [Effrenium voratum]|nr:unnamed protein product [Effrenium voratum]